MLCRIKSVRHSIVLKRGRTDLMRRSIVLKRGRIMLELGRTKAVRLSIISERRSIKSVLCRTMSERCRIALVPHSIMLVRICAASVRFIVEIYFTTIFTNRFGTTMIFTICLPSVCSLIFASSNARRSKSSFDASGDVKTRERNFPLT